MNLQEDPFSAQASAAFGSVDVGAAEGAGAIADPHAQAQRLHFLEQQQAGHLSRMAQLEQHLSQRSTVQPKEVHPYKFGGKPAEDPDDWILQCEELAQRNGLVTDDQYIQTYRAFLKEDALACYSAKVREEGRFSTWAQFVAELRETFDTPVDVALNNLYLRTQGPQETVRQYELAIRKLSLQSQVGEVQRKMIFPTRTAAAAAGACAGS